VQNLVHSDKCLSIRALAVQLNLDKETVRQVLSDNLGMRKVLAKMASQLLTDEQKQQHTDVCSDLSS
jgi:hypothetical protein